MWARRDANSVTPIACIKWWSSMRRLSGGCLIFGRRLTHWVTVSAAGTQPKSRFCDRPVISCKVPCSTNLAMATLVGSKVLLMSRLAVRTSITGYPMSISALAQSSSSAGTPSRSWNYSRTADFGIGRSSVRAATFTTKLFCSQCFRLLASCSAANSASRERRSSYRSPRVVKSQRRQTHSSSTCWKSLSRASPNSPTP